MIKRILSVFLAVLMVAGLVTVAASAEEKPAKTFNYVAFGDSIAAGYGLTAPGTANDPALILSEELIANPIQDAYAHVFGERLAEIGAEYGYTTSTTNLSSTAYRAEDVAETIKTPGYKGVVAAYILEAFVGEGASEALVPYHDIYNKYLADADMVSIQLGGNDIVMGIIYPMIQSDNPILNDMAIAVALLLFGRTPTEAVGAGVKLIIRDKDKITVDHIAEATKFFADVKDNAEQYVIDSADYVEGVVENVQEVRPEADIALIGMYNPYGNSLEYDGQVRDMCTVMQNMFAAAVDEAIDVNITVGDIEIVPAADAEEKADDLKSVAIELNEIVVNNSYFREMQKERIKALVNIAAKELAYPIQYLTAGKNVDPQMKLLNELLQGIAEEHGATFVDVYDISNECNTDPHPTAAGHKEIADRLEAAMMESIIAKMTAAPAAKLADINGDGEIDMVDVVMMQRYLADFEFEDFNLAAADIDGDGEVTVLDVAFVQRWLADIEIPYAIGEPVEA